MGYMCEIMDDEDSVPPAVVNKILGTIVDGIQASRSDPVRLAATQALNNSLYFTEANFASETERNVLVTAMCEATQCRDVNVRKAAYECLGRVAELYYDHLGPYVATIFNLTTTAIRTERVSL
jgi:importin subunit beta-1